MSSDIKLRAWQKQGGLPNASYDTFTIQELMSGRYKYSNYKNWEQFTGYQDQKGTEIFEGDIIKTSVGNREVKRLSLGWSLMLRDSEVEIIGNVTEHPHLLEGHDSK